MYEDYGQSRATAVMKLPRYSPMNQQWPLLLLMFCSYFYKATEDEDEEEENDEEEESVVSHHKKYHKAHLKYHTLKKNKVRKHGKKVSLGE